VVVVVVVEEEEETEVVVEKEEEEGTSPPRWCNVIISCFAHVESRGREREGEREEGRLFNKWEKRKGWFTVSER
jgi:hypothetical protein